MLRLYRPFVGRQRLFQGLIVLTLLMGSFYLATTHLVRASAPWSWVEGGEPTAAVLNDRTPPDLNYVPGSGERKECTKQDVFVGDLALTTEQICVYQAEGFRYGFRGYWGAPMLVSLPADERMYQVYGAPSRTSIIDIPSSPHVAWRHSRSWAQIGNELRVVRNFASQLIRELQPDQTVYYRLNESAIESLGNPKDENEHFVGSVGSSDNGRWLLAEFHAGIARFDLKSGEIQYFSSYQPAYMPGYNHKKEFAITDDGSYIAVAGRYVYPKVYDLTGGCGQKVGSLAEAVRVLPHFKPCPEKDLANVLSKTRGIYYDSALLPSFNYDGGELTVWVEPYYTLNVPHEARWVKLTATNYAPSNLEYLALGDSYSSGEGDVGFRKEGIDYYQSFPNAEESKCHLSVRSYPFLVRDNLNISAQKMHSVACSGAQVVADYNRPLTGYFGQGRWLENKVENNRLSLQRGAIDEFIPSRIPQLEFVKKHQPSIVTLTGGGNDVGFSDILKYCAWDEVSTSPLQQVAWGSLTCGYAKENSELKETLASVIESQYTYSKSLIQQMQKYSPQTKIYTIGYPQFIAEGPTVCANSLMLNKTERQMIYESVRYLNGVLKRVARDTNTTYIDIEDTLLGGRLCEGSEYLTGIWDIDPLDDSQQSNLFHPNAEGHQRIAARVTAVIRGEVVQTPTQSLSISAFFEGVKNNIRAYRQQIVNDIVTKGQQVTLKTFAQGIQATASVSLYSDEISLGNVAVSSDGNIQTDVTIPADVPVGFHELVIKGRDQYGREVRIFESVRVQSADPYDRNDNQVNDDIDLCGFAPRTTAEGAPLQPCVAAVNSTDQGRSSPSPAALGGGAEARVAATHRAATVLPISDESAPNKLTPPRRILGVNVEGVKQAVEKGASYPLASTLGGGVLIIATGLLARRCIKR